MYSCMLHTNGFFNINFYAFHLISNYIIFYLRTLVVIVVMKFVRATNSPPLVHCDILRIYIISNISVAKTVRH